MMLSSVWVTRGILCHTHKLLLPLSARALHASAADLRRGQHPRDPPAGSDTALGGRVTFEEYERASSGSAPHFRRDLQRSIDKEDKEEKKKAKDTFGVKSKEGQRLTEADVDGVGLSDISKSCMFHLGTSWEYKFLSSGHSQGRRVY